MLVGIGISAVLGDLGGEYLAKLVAPIVFKTETTVTSASDYPSVARAAFAEYAPEEGAVGQNIMLIGFFDQARVNPDDLEIGGTENGELRTYFDDLVRARRELETWKGKPGFRYAALYDAANKDVLDQAVGEISSSSSSVVEVSQESTPAFKVFQFASKAFIGATAYALGHELGVWK